MALKPEGCGRRTAGAGFGVAAGPPWIAGRRQLLALRISNLVQKLRHSAVEWAANGQQLEPVLSLSERGLGDRLLNLRCVDRDLGNDTVQLRAFELRHARKATFFLLEAVRRFLGSVEGVAEQRRQQHAEERQPRQPRRRPRWRTGWRPRGGRGSAAPSSRRDGSTPRPATAPTCSRRPSWRPPSESHAATRWLRRQSAHVSHLGQTGRQVDWG